MEPIKIGFVLLSSARNPLPSTRIAVLNMLAFLTAAHFESHIIFEPPHGAEEPDIEDQAERLQAEGFRIVFFQKVHGPSVEKLARRLTALGVKTVFGVCDLVEPAMVEATDMAVAVTEYLKGLYPPHLQRKMHIVHDGIENPVSCKTSWSDHAGSPYRPLRAVLITSSNLSHLPVIGRPPEWLDMWIVGNYPRSSDYRRRLKEMRWELLGQRRRQRAQYLGFLMDRSIRRIPWDPVGVYEHLESADIGVIPIDATAAPAEPGAVPSWKLKSENRLTLKMAAGLPVIATPIPAYEAVIEHGKNGFLAASRQDWQRCLDALRDPQLRRHMGECARSSVLVRYSKDAQAQRLIAVFDMLLRDGVADLQAG